jgi:hypothetical protein
MTLRLMTLATMAALALAIPAAAPAAASVTASCNGTVCSTGWYTSNVNVSFNVSGTIISGCTPVTISVDQNVPPLSNQPHCEVSDGSSQSITLYVPIKRDATPPTTTGIAAQRAPDSNGWYNHAVGVAASGTDAMSGIASCSSVTYSGPDAASASVSGTCTDNAGNVSAPTALSFQYDATPPSVSAAPARGADANGWYNHAVDVAFQATDPVSGVDSCTSGSYAGPDSGSASVAGTCRDKAGNTANGSFGLRYDATPPSVTAGTPDRQPDANGWYNHRLVVTYAGADATSGIASCDTLPYDKPDDAAAKVSGRCRDNAGNASAPSNVDFKFDSTPPKLAKLAVNAGDSSVAMTWSASADVASVKITRTRAGATTPVTLYDGKRLAAFTDKKVKDGSRYAYLVAAFDQAGNEADAKIEATPSAPLLAPRKSAVVHGGTTLRWRPAPGATYYNVQLWLSGRKVLTTWPAAPSLQLTHLRPGAYTWFVWPGRGPRPLHRYGPLLGRSTFVVRG